MRGKEWTRTGKITQLPKYLTINMVRFFWKTGANVKAKIMRAVKFPAELDMYEYCDFGAE